MCVHHTRTQIPCASPVCDCRQWKRVKRKIFEYTRNYTTESGRGSPRFLVWESWEAPLSAWAAHGLQLRFSAAQRPALPVPERARLRGRTRLHRCHLRRAFSLEAIVRRRELDAAVVVPGAQRRARLATWESEQVPRKASLLPHFGTKHPGGGSSLTTLS